MGHQSATDASPPDFNSLHPQLPIFAISHDQGSILYTPGRLVLASEQESDELARHWSSGAALATPELEQKADWLVERATAATASWRAWERLEFTPECLTLYPSNACNLACGYCYSACGAPRSQAGLLSIAAVEAAARLVAENCRAKGLPFSLVLHGGGEPALHSDLMQKACRLTRAIASQYGLDWQSYIATNGVMDEKTALWLARHVGRICLSCDGPPDVQDVQRPLLGGAPSSSSLERASRIIRNAGGVVEARATITPATVERQVEVLEYVVDALGARAVRLEPVYRRGAEGFRAGSAPVFVANFLKAQARAANLGVDLSYSGVRLDELHGPYCNTLKQALNLVPDGSAVACFFHVERGVPAWSRIGEFRPGAGFVLDQAKIEAHRRMAARIPEICARCVCVFHCARGCPEACPATDNANPDLGADVASAQLFRCEVNRRLAVAWIRQVKPGVHAATPGLEIVETAPRLAQILHAFPADIDTEAILEAARILPTDYRIEAHRMPRPLWARRSFDLDGASAWEAVQRQAAECPPEKGISIYVHVPFCDRRCGFCDCLSRPLPARRLDPAERFVEVAQREIARWAGIPALRSRRVTTVHFGGGTPNHLSPPLLERLVSDLRGAFTTDARTEWALESTGSLLTADHLDWLRELGFRRLHVGVQTLDDSVRRKIGRRDDRPALLRRLEVAISKRFVTSVDLIYGLPGESAGGWVDGLREMAGLGIHGVSLYQLNVSTRNRRFLRSCGLDQPDHLFNYALFQAAEQSLLRAGYRKAFFNHYARPEDEYLYYCYLQRGEDLVAVGPTADGLMGELLFRHHDLDVYLDAAAPGLEGGLTKSAAEERMTPVEVALMSGRVSAQMVTRLDSLGQAWITAGLLAPGDESGAYALTANGSWLIARMLEEADRLAG